MEIFVRNRKESTLELKQQRNKRLQKSDWPLWEATDFDKQHYELPYLPERESYAKFDLSKVSNHSSKADIFRNFYSDEFLKQIWDYYDVSRWAYTHHFGIATLHDGAFKLSGMLILLAVKIKNHRDTECAEREQKERPPLEKELRRSTQSF